MDWIKISTDSVLLSEHTNRELITLIKYQALYCQLEREPNDFQMKRYFTKKDIDFLLNWKQSVSELSLKQIKKVKQKRGIDKDYYKKKQTLSKNSEFGKSSFSESREDKIRIDKNIKDTKVSKKDKLEEFENWNYKEDDVFLKWIEKLVSINPNWGALITPRRILNAKDDLITDINKGVKKYTNYKSALQTYVKNSIKWELERKNGR